MRVARLAGQGFEGPRDARQFLHPGLLDDEFAGERGGANATPARSQPS
jgi:hypothetical protein